MSGIAHHLVKRGLDATHEQYRSGSFAQDAGDKKPFGHPHAVAAALVITGVAWFFAANAVSHHYAIKATDTMLIIVLDLLHLWRRRGHPDHDRNPHRNRL